jgi:hypothetical protein
MSLFMGMVIVVVLGGAKWHGGHRKSEDGDANCVYECGVFHTIFVSWGFLFLLNASDEARG